ncbi:MULTISPECIES: class D sortase [Niallia]|jgi:sortase A|uniref:Class D sortase n=1 Tax=Niallia circulans TaxID=1397 RepID=A0A268FCD4_NIACI|nr:class D sortase [Niallia circulans]AYV67712.1 class D sortase [Niallia circulans]AYV73944.1 class D sortase [Niallia circulans]NRG29956.1 class D sortase [Niallia circulans]PAD83021.1 class D sortase [Niallia circulans]UQZ76260.1 class D sortase [Niallia circulans]
MKWTRWLSLLLILGGVLFIGYGVWNIMDTKAQTKNSLSEAKAAINKGNEKWVDKESKRFVPSIGDAVGLLKIDKIDGELPIVEGTDPDDLEKGVGHYKGSFYPDENGQIVLSGHRDTVFRRAGELEIGDELKIVLPYGEFSYQITATKIVEADDQSIITLDDTQEELILTTCYPFRFVGNAPQRYIIYAKRIE